MFRILVTDASYKNAIALTRYVRRATSDLYIIGHDSSHGRFPGWYGAFDAVLTGPLETALENTAFDLVIPVGGLSVLTVARMCPERAVLPPGEKLDICYDKFRSVELAKSVGVPAPETWLIHHPDELVNLPTSFPCVVKPSREGTGLKLVSYCQGLEELRGAVSHQLDCLRGGAAILVQEFIDGRGYGFFGLMDHGTPVRVFMHQRIREYPPSGGPSTAARAFYSERLKGLGLMLLSALQWHGVAMVEFKYSDEKNDFVLMEINGKFWGSLELALSAGVNFGADLIRQFRGEHLSYSEAYNRNQEFYWPLDDDVLTLWRTRSLRRIADYWKPNARTNLFQSLRADALKSLRLAKKIVTAPSPYRPACATARQPLATGRNAALGGAN